MCVYNLSEVDISKGNLLVRIGDKSYGIYLSHIFVKVILVYSLSLLPFFEEYSVLFLPLETLLTLFVCFIVIDVMDKILPDRILFYIGFKS